jgi:hypothetical protein
MLVEAVSRHDDVHGIERAGEAGSYRTSPDPTRLFESWIKGSSDAERAHQVRAVAEVEGAIVGHPQFQSASVRVYARGSYRNKTCIPLDSDIDILVEDRAVVCSDEAPHIAGPRAFPSAAGNPYPLYWRESIIQALIAAFGEGRVDTAGDVAIVVRPGEPGSPSIDVVPSFSYRSLTEGDQLWGIAALTKDSRYIVNYPQQQLINGRQKNSRSGGRYKKYARAIKAAENLLSSSGQMPAVSSYLLECLIWNAPIDVLRSGSLREGFTATLCWLWEHLSNTSQYLDWLEPDGIKSLFHPNQRWNVESARQVVCCIMDMTLGQPVTLSAI